MAEDEKKKGATVVVTPEQDAAMTYTMEELERAGKPMGAPPRSVAMVTKEPEPPVISSQKGGGEAATASQQSGQEVVYGSDGNNGNNIVEVPSYLADWSQGWENGLRWLKNEKGQQALPTEVIMDYNRWAKANDQAPLDAFQFYPWLAKYDATKTIGENEKEEKRRKNQEKWERLGNVFSHIGNLIGTMNGAPSQTLETGPQLTRRQQELYDHVMRQRQGMAKDMLSAYYRRMAEQRQREMAASMEEYRKSQAEAARKNAENREKEADSRIKKNEAQAEAAKKNAENNSLRTQATVEYTRARTVAAANGRNISRGGGRGRGRSAGSKNGLGPGMEKVTRKTKDENGTTTTTWVQPRKSGKDVPPSRKKAQNNSNIPPSRRK